MTTAFKTSGRGLRRLATNSPPVTLVLAHAGSPQRKMRRGGLRSSGDRACIFQPGDVTDFRFLGWTVETLAHTTAIFRQVNKNEPMKHHDALEFPDGRIVLLTRLSEGQEATVLQLPAQPTSTAEADAQKRIVTVG